MLMNFSLSGKLVMFFLLLASVSVWMMAFDHAFVPPETDRMMAFKAAAVVSIGLHFLFLTSFITVRLYLPGLMGKSWS